MAALTIWPANSSSTSMGVLSRLKKSAALDSTILYRPKGKGRDEATPFLSVWMVSTRLSVWAL